MLQYESLELLDEEIELDSEEEDEEEDDSELLDDELEDDTPTVQ